MKGIIPTVLSHEQSSTMNQMSHGKVTRRDKTMGSQNLEQVQTLVVTDSKAFILKRLG